MSNILNNMKSIKCHCGCGRDLDFTDPKGAIIPKDHYFDVKTLTLKLRKRKIVTLPNYQLN